MKPDGKPAGMFIPDFVARHPSGCTDVLVEIVGYWRGEYLRRKLSHIEMVRDQTIFLIVNAHLALERGNLEQLIAAFGNKSMKSHVHCLLYANRRELKDVVRTVVGALEAHRMTVNDEPRFE